MRLCGMILIIAVTEKGKTMDENYISLERAIERMYEVTEECGTERIFIDRIIDELENLPSSPHICIHPQWIPVSERLPDHIGVFIVAIREPFKERVGKDCANFDPFAKSWLPSMCWDKGYKVTHWMELPEPPGEGSNGQA